MQVSKLEELSARLHRLRDQLGAAPSDDQPLEEGDQLVRAARACEFMLPERLTVASLRETVDHKIETVGVLLERARKHEALPDEAQLVADQEYTATEEDYEIGRREQGCGK
jgi:hypothetical protein